MVSMKRLPRCRLLRSHAATRTQHASPASAQRHGLLDQGLGATGRDVYSPQYSERLQQDVQTGTVRTEHKGHKRETQKAQKTDFFVPFVFPFYNRIVSSRDAPVDTMRIGTS